MHPCWFRKDPDYWCNRRGLNRAPHPGMDQGLSGAHRDLLGCFPCRRILPELTASFVKDITGVPTIRCCDTWSGATSTVLLWLCGSISILLPTAMFLKVLSTFCRNLIIRPLVHCCNTDDASTKIEGTMMMLWRVDQVSSAQRAYRSPTWVNQKDDL